MEGPEIRQVVVEDLVAVEPQTAPEVRPAVGERDDLLDETEGMRGSAGGGDEGEAGFWAVGADFLWRI